MCTGEDCNEVSLVEIVVYKTPSFSFIADFLVAWLCNIFPFLSFFLVKSCVPLCGFFDSSFIHSMYALKYSN